MTSKGFVNVCKEHIDLFDFEEVKTTTYVYAHSSWETKKELRVLVDGKIIVTLPIQD